MGNYFKSVPSAPYDEKLILFLKTKSIHDVNQAIEILNDSYPTHSTLTLVEYLDAFGGIFEDKTEQVFQLLENKHNLDGEVDIYESLAVIIVYCGEEFPVKLEFVFKMFDFDKSGEIEKKELIMTLQTCIRSLCKLANLKAPDLNTLEYFAEKVFLQLDADRSQSISFHEFSVWLSNSWELQDFLLQYAMIQTFENADRRTKEMKIFYTKLFEIAAGGGDVETCEQESIKMLLEKELEKQKPDIIKMLIDTLTDSSKEYALSQDLEVGKMYKVPYQEVMSAWAAFDATDINHDNQTSLTELKYLLYAYEGDFPDVFRIKSEMAILDKDKSGYVSRDEWIQYLCVHDKGKFVFRGNLLFLFNKFDVDNSGTLTLIEIRSLLTDSMRDLYLKFKHKGQQDLEDFEGMITTLANEIIETLNSEEDKLQNDRTLTWIEFKRFMEEAMAKMEKLREFLKGF